MFANKLVIAFGVIAAVGIVIALAAADIEIFAPASASAACVKLTAMPSTWYGDCDHQ